MSVQNTVQVFGARVQRTGLTVVKRSGSSVVRTSLLHGECRGFDSLSDHSQKGNRKLRKAIYC